MLCSSLHILTHSHFSSSDWSSYCGVSITDWASASLPLLRVWCRAVWQAGSWKHCLLSPGAQEGFNLMCLFPLRICFKTPQGNSPLWCIFVRKWVNIRMSLFGAVATGERKRVVILHLLHDPSVMRGVDLDEWVRLTVRTPVSSYNVKKSPNFESVIHSDMYWTKNCVFFFCCSTLIPQVFV